MEQKIEKTQIGMLPAVVMDEIEEKIKHYVIGLLGVNVVTTGDEVQLLGSGTLIQINSKFFILTVGHLVRKLKKYHQLGLILVDTFAHKFVINTSVLNIIEIGNSATEVTGPDLALIILPDIHSSTIKAYKSFWNILYHKENALKKPIIENLNQQLWIACGFIEKWTKNMEASGAFTETKAYCCLCGPTGAEEYWTSGDFDYIKLSVLYKNRDDLPTSFGGLSGGGLWRADLFKSKEGVISCSTPLLLGVAYYETEIHDDFRSIRGHGWHSIYDRVLSEALKNYDLNT